jgi:hypothetical protein
VDSAGSHGLVHHIRGEATPDEHALGTFTRRKLKERSLEAHLWRTLSRPT